MDFADATLVHLAARESLSVILTVITTIRNYRIAGRSGSPFFPPRSEVNLE